MQNFQTVNQEQILKKLTGDFSAFQQGKEGKGREETCLSS